MTFPRHGLKQQVSQEQVSKAQIAKAQVRRESLARRDAFALDVERAVEAAEAARAHALALAALGTTDTGTVAGYWPIRSEIDPRPVMLALSQRGTSLALPVIVGGELVFRACSHGVAKGRRRHARPFARSGLRHAAPAAGAAGGVDRLQARGPATARLLRPRPGALGRPGAPCSVWPAHRHRHRLCVPGGAAGAHGAA